LFTERHGVFGRRDRGEIGDARGNPGLVRGKRVFGAFQICPDHLNRARIAVGRKNWLFIGSLRAGIRNASLMSLVASALRQDLDVAMYLESVITHMLRGTAKTEELLPDRWKAAHPEAVREYREQERRDKADMAVVQAARRRVRAELRQGK
jgi:hypothetical protein